MSLFDSFLLDPQKFDVWIAPRTDGLKGSGTESDPYNGSPRLQSLIPVSNLAASGQEATATATSHGYSNGDAVTIAGATGTGAQYFNGRFVIYSVTANSFKYWMVLDPGTSSATGTITCARTFFQFDEIMNSVAANTTIHLGSGGFETKGQREGTADAWQPKSGQKIIGSGMDVTVLKRVCASVANSKHSVIGTAGYIDYFEVSDLTLDCNLAGQTIYGYTFSPISCAGIAVSGSHLNYRRVRVINFGSLHPDLECFVLWSAGSNPDGNPEPTDCVIEDCIIEQPAIDNYAIITCIAMGCMERATDGVMAYHRACVVRNCVV